jgi:nucleotide-binding universal stress UspA family protein
MYRHILVPLDGSTFSEASIPYSIYLALTFGAKVTLIHIVEQNAPQHVHGEHHISSRDEAVRYFEGIIRDRFPDDVEVDFHVHKQEKINVVKAIAMHHEELSSDIIVMTTHGWGGIKEILYGNNAQQILNLGTIPVLFVPPNNIGRNESTCMNRILIPLDGTKEHEPGLETAVILAGSCHAEIYLTLVVPTLNTLKAGFSGTGLLLPGSTSELLNIIEQEAVDYFIDKKNEIEKSGLKVNVEIYRGEPSAIIAGIAEKYSIDLIVLGTHGKSGMNAFWSGSLAAKLAGKTRTAILMIPLK